MGGIDIDEHAQVLDTDQRPIPGLFAAGATTGGLEGGKNSTYLGGLIKAGSFGLLAAERIAALEGKSFTVNRPAVPDTGNHPEADQLPAAPRALQGQAIHGLARFPILNMVARHSKALAAIASLGTGAVVAALGWQLLSWYVLPIALVAAGLSLVVVLGLGELVVMVTELLMPE